MAQIESDELREKIVEDCDELKGIAYLQVIKVINELEEKSKCRGCMGAAFGDCERCRGKSDE